ncbi:hypothetical protein DB88DRAFT_218833 [Papiliotrema laurentii]|uniref:IMS import disulfide relay-system CHCH-CHCH-like Cx9C domain-containing protein n=1 Tax=Papiliotrema laurentii TaxID=5418 RepID=A0AAD9FTB4_PAPLA|nr:hypothetical protein DB88DRAFT_218833 [Papiliotrema laurentii]
MDLSYNAECASQMARYQECVVKNATGDWSNICRPEGRALAQCADESVPHLAELKSACVDQIEKYRSCLDSNSLLADEQVAEKCGGLMSDLWKCSERAMAEIEARGATGQAASGSERLV